MGNCQAAEAATLVIQHPEGKIDRLYWPTTADEVMKSNPGHHVALVITSYISKQQENDISRLRCVRVRILKHNHILLTGQVYRLVTEQEVTRTLEERKDSRSKKRHSQLREDIKADQITKLTEERNQEVDQERHQQKSSAKSVARTRQWHPSLRIISEDGI